MIEFDSRSFARSMQARARRDFTFFVIGAFKQLHDEHYAHNWHVQAICHQVMRIVHGQTKRLMIAMPPRTMKSFIGSVCLPAWLLGRNPGEKVICASYGQDLARVFSFQMRQLMQTAWYKRIFPNTHIDPKKSGQDELRTTRGGYRLSTSTGGVLTGRGGNYVIIDDPMKAADAMSEVARANAFNWYTNTVVSRFDNPNDGKMIVIAQRLHMEDLPGQLLQMGGWDLLELPLIEWDEREIDLFPGQWISRPPGHILQEDRFSEETIARLRSENGEQAFEAQYNQRPLPPGGALFQLQWLKRYETAPRREEIEGIFQSWDTAYEIDETNDYSVCSTWALSGKRCFLLDIYRERLQFPDLEKAVYKQREKWKAGLVIVEDSGSGKSILHNIRRYTGGQTWIQGKKPAGSKQDRASEQAPKFERGEVWVPTEAPWLRAFLDELAVFPQGKHDDQVDSVVQFLASVDTGRLLFMADAARRR